MAGGPRRPADRGPRRRARFTLLHFLLLLIVLALLAVVWLGRGWWIPRYRERLPQPLADALREPRAEIDWLALEDGLGIGLTMLGDIHDFTSATRDWRPEWQVTTGKGGTLRVEGGGLFVYTSENIIESYHVNIDRLFADDEYSELQQAFQSAGISDELTWPALTGQQQMPAGLKEYRWTSPRSLDYRRGRVQREFVLTFADGWLRKFETGLAIGAASSAAGPDGAAMGSGDAGQVGSSVGQDG